VYFKLFFMDPTVWFCSYRLTIRCCAVYCCVWFWIILPFQIILLPSLLSDWSVFPIKCYHFCISSLIPQSHRKLTNLWEYFNVIFVLHFHFLFFYILHLGCQRIHNLKHNSKTSNVQSQTNFFNYHTNCLAKSNKKHSKWFVQYRQIYL